METSHPRGKPAALAVRLPGAGFLALMLVPTAVSADAPQARMSAGESSAAPRERWSSRLDVGGKAGISLAMFAGPGTNEERVSYSFRTSVSMGGAVGYKLTDAVAVQAELALTAKGPHGAIDGVHFGTYYMSYLEVPLLVRVTLPLPGTVTYHAVLGPTLSILLDADLALADGRALDVQEWIEPVDVGVTLGAGAAMAIGARGQITLDVRYHRGFFNFDRTAATDQDEIMHQSAYVMVGYRANLDALLRAPRAPGPASDRAASRAPEADAPAPR